MPSKLERLRIDMRKAHGLLSTDPQQARELAEGLLERVGPFQDLRGEVLHLLGIARHYSGDVEGAYSAFQSASEVESSPLLLGHVYCRWALLEADRERLREALRKAAKGVALVEGSEPSRRDLAQALVARGLVFWSCEDYDSAEHDNRRALTLAHPRTDAKVYLSAVHNLGLVLLFGDKHPQRIREALATLAEAGKLLRRFRIPVRSMQSGVLIWTKGLAYRMAGADERGEALLKKARTVFEEIEAWTEWRRVSLDLIESYMHYDQWGHVRRTATEMLQLTTDSAATASLKAFLEAVKKEAVSDGILRNLYHSVHGKQRKVPPVFAEDDELDPIGF